MNKFLLLILLGLICCKRDKGLTVPDVQFPDAETQFIKLNEIDTTFIFYPQGDQGPEIKTYKTYDKNGRVLFDNTSMVAFERTYYDNRGLPIKIETGHSAPIAVGSRVYREGAEVSRDSASYKFDEENRVLEQTWTKGLECRYRLDDKWRVIEVIRSSVSADEKREKDKSIYKYDNDRLVQTLGYWKRERMPDVKVKIDYYYSINGVLDSSVMKVSADKLRYKYVYDKDGLQEKQYHGDYLDTRRFLHKRRPSKNNRNKLR